MKLLKLFIGLVLFACSFALSVSPETFGCSGKDGLTYATVLFTAAASTTTSFTPQWASQYLVFETATVPTALSVTRLGAVQQMVNLDGAGITSVNNFLKPALVSSAGIYCIPIADGLIIANNMNISITNATATPFIVYGISRKLKGTKFLSARISQVLANSGQTFTDFDGLLFNAMATTDKLVVTDWGGNADNYESDSLEDMSSFDQAVIQPQMNNMDGNYKMANFTPSANRNVIVLKYIPA